MVNQLHNLGEEAVLDAFFGQAKNVEVFLYNESSSTIADAGTMSDVQGEPTDGNYTRKTYALNVDFVKDTSSGNTLYEITNMEWDVENTTGTVDAYGVIDQSSGDLLWTGALNNSKDLGPIDRLEQDKIGLSLN